MSEPTSLPPDDTYFIYATAQGQNVYLEFTDGSQGTNLSTWHFSGDDSQQVQTHCHSNFRHLLILYMIDLQWQLASSSDTFTVKNIRYNNYMSHSEGNPFVVASLSPFGWSLRAVDGGYLQVFMCGSLFVGVYLMVEKYRMSNDSSFASTVNIANGVAADDNPVRYIQ